MNASSSPILSRSAKKKAESPSPQPCCAAVGSPSAHSSSSIHRDRINILNNITNAAGMMITQNEAGINFDRRWKLLHIQKDKTRMLQASEKKRHDERKEHLQVDREMQEKVVELQEKMLKMEEAGRVAREQESKMKFMQDQKLIQRFSQDQNATVELEYEVTLSTVKKPANSFAAPNYSAVAMDMGGSILKYDEASPAVVGGANPLDKDLKPAPSGGGGVASLPVAMASNEQSFGGPPAITTTGFVFRGPPAITTTGFVFGDGQGTLEPSATSTIASPQREEKVASLPLENAALSGAGGGVASRPVIFGGLRLWPT